MCATHAYMFCLIDKIYKKAHRSLYTVNDVLLLYYIHNSGVSSPRVTTLFFSQSIIIPIFLYPSVMSCAISSLHAPHGGKGFAVTAYSDNTLYFVLSVCQHIKRGAALGAYAESTCTINTYTGIYPARKGFYRCRNSARLNPFGIFPRGKRFFASS